MTFHNTNNESGGELNASMAQAKHQEEVILDYFKLHPDEEFTPFEIQNAVGLISTPITSIRRAITNLCSSGILIKTDNQRVGQYGKKNFCWKFNSDAISPFKPDPIHAPANIYDILEQEKKFQTSTVGAPEQSENKSKPEKQQKLF